MEKRLREGLPLIPATKAGLSEDKDFVAKVRDMLFQYFPQVQEVLRNDYGDVIEPASPKRGAGAGNSQTPPPPSGGASYGGPAAARQLERAPAFGGGSEGVTVAGAMAAPVTTGESLRVGKSGILPGAGGDKKVSAS